MITMLFTFFTLVAQADTNDLSDVIFNLCQMNSDVSEEDKMECGLYYVNCIVGKGGKWEEKDILRCVRDFDKK